MESFQNLYAVDEETTVEGEEKEGEERKNDGDDNNNNKDDDEGEDDDGAIMLSRASLRPDKQRSSVRRLMDGTNSFEEICGRTGISHAELCLLVENMSDVVVMMV